jgi:hypothetical protein
MQAAAYLKHACSAFSLQFAIDISDAVSEYEKPRGILSSTAVNKLFYSQ